MIVTGPFKNEAGGWQGSCTCGWISAGAYKRPGAVAVCSEHAADHQQEGRAPAVPKLANVRGEETS